MTSGINAPDVMFNKDKFRYNPDADCYVCPIGTSLSFKKSKKRKDGKIDRVYSNIAICKNCPHLKQCTKNKHGREVFAPGAKTKIKCGQAM